MNGENNSTANERNSQVTCPKCGNSFDGKEKKCPTCGEKIG